MPPRSRPSSGRSSRCRSSSTCSATAASATTRATSRRFTQPLMYKAIRSHRVDARHLCQAAGRRERRHRRRSREDACRLARPSRRRAGGEPELQGQPRRLARRPLGRHEGRGVRQRTIRAAATPASPSRSSKDIGSKITKVPEGFHVHRTIQRFLDARQKAIETGEGIDWATAEALAFCSLLLEGHPVRFQRPGQRARHRSRQRHSVLIDQETEDRYTPFNHLEPTSRRATRSSTRCSRKRRCSGFEYGYSLAEPNCADALGSPVRRLRQRRPGGASTSSSPRASASGCACPASVCLLPHGLRGPGPGAFVGPSRALSADVRRGQHAGRQLHDAGQLLPHPAPSAEARDPQAADPDDAEVAAAPQAGGVAARRDGPPAPRSTACCGTTRRLLPGEKIKLVEDAKIRRVVMCTGKVYYDLYEEREKRGIDDIYLLPRRAALSVPDQGAGHRARPLQAGRGRLVPGRAAQHGRVALRRALSSNGCSTRSRPSSQRPRCATPPGVGRDRGRPDVEALRRS